MKIIRRLSRGAFVLAAITTAIPALATPVDTLQPPEETVLARHSGYIFPSALRLFSGGRLPRGEYELALVRTEEGLCLQITDRDGKGGRVPAAAIAQVGGEAPDLPETTSILLWKEGGQALLIFQSEGLAASFSLTEIKRTL